RADGLKSGSVSLTSSPFAVANSFARRLPGMPKVPLPEGGVDLAAADTMPLPGKIRSRAEFTPSGRFTQTFSYSGPSSSGHGEADARDGKRIYADRDYTFVGLPNELQGSDYVQTANADKLYTAEDLMEVTVKRGAVVAIAHDDRLPRPAWLARQFSATTLTLSVN